MQEPKVSPHWPEQLSFIVWPGAAESVRTWTSVFSADTGVKVNIVPENDIVKRFRGVKSGAFDFTAGFGNETSQMLAGNREFACRDGGPFPVRIIWSWSRSASGFYVRAGSGIRTPQDIRPGTRIADMRPFLSSIRIVEALLAWAGLGMDDVTWIPVRSTKEAAEGVFSGRIDLSFGVPSSAPVLEAANSPHGIDWIELNSKRDPDGADRFKKVYPLVNFAPMPPDSPASSAGKWLTEGINYLVGRRDHSAGFIHNFVKWLDNNYSRYKDLHPDNQHRDLATLVRGLNFTYIPVHEGLISYLKEKQLWTDLHERRNRANLDLVDRYCDAYQKAIEAADARQILVSPESTEWVKLWQEYKKQAGLPAFRVFNSLDET
ncbi:MAG: ABC transporter substrate-binding protein [Dehalococcoidia bacterium]|nr:ABC transporter substrate-binding protein [Dehalococcoidia bacterium]